MGFIGKPGIFYLAILVGGNQETVTMDPEGKMADEIKLEIWADYI